MAARPEICGEAAAATTEMAASPSVVHQSSPKTEVSVVKTDENENINVANFDVGSVVTNFESKKGPKDSKSELKMQNIIDMLPSLKLNPMANEFVPSSSSYSPIDQDQHELALNYLAPAFYQNSVGNQIAGYPNNGSWRNDYSQDRRRLSGSSSGAQREDRARIRRTVYVSDIDHNVSEERLAALFGVHGQVRDCRVCGDPYSSLRFAFVEFGDENAARAALNLCGTMLGRSKIRVLPSKTAILPVNPTLLPQSEDEKELCARTVCCTNIDKQVTQAAVRYFFETRCGRVSCLRLLGDQFHSTRMAFIEFVRAESASRALDCCGQLLGRQKIRVNPSKTPVRPRRARRSPAH